MATGEGGGVLLALCRWEDLREEKSIDYLMPQKRLQAFLFLPSNCELVQVVLEVSVRH